MTPSHDAGLRILAPLDDSVESQRALTCAQALAAATGCRLKLVRATDLDDEARFNSLVSSARRLQDAGVDVEWSVVSGVDGQKAIREAEAEWQPDLIALATTSLSGLDRWVNGSVAETVVKSAPSTRNAIARTPSTTWGTLPRAWNRCWKNGTSRGVIVESPATAILDSPCELGVDAIAMSTRGHGAAHFLSIGSTAAKVVDQASVPVILLGPGALTDMHGARV